MPGWGILPWGLGGFGGVVPLTIIGARATSERTVEVTLSTNALARSTIGTGDATNPSTWRVAVLNSSGGIAEYRNIGGVRTITNNTVFELYLLQLLRGYLFTHRVIASGLLRADYAALTPPNWTNFAGLEAARSATETSSTLRDLRGAAIHGLDGSDGRVAVNIGGDYATHTGRDLLTKLIIRRLTTTPGAFLWMRRDQYGIGLRLKEPLPFGAGRAFRAELERQVKMEPEVADCAATITDDPPGVLVIQLRVKMLNGTEDVITLPPIPT